MKVEIDTALREYLGAQGLESSQHTLMQDIRHCYCNAFLAAFERGVGAGKASTYP